MIVNKWVRRVILAPPLMHLRIVLSQLVHLWGLIWAYTSKATSARLRIRLSGPGGAALIPGKSSLTRQLCRCGARHVH